MNKPNYSQTRSGMKSLARTERYTGMIVASGFFRSRHLWELYGLKRNREQNHKPCDILQISPMRLFELAWTLLCLACRAIRVQSTAYFYEKSYRRSPPIVGLNN